MEKQKIKKLNQIFQKKNSKINIKKYESITNEKELENGLKF